jgi:GTP-binding protein
MGNLVAIVGRPNVGKSTLFNRLIGGRDAIVDEISGVTRDRHYGRTEWNGHEFSVIDTGGYVSNSDDIFEEEIRKQVKLAIEEADVIIFLVDVTGGITDLDDAVADILRKSKKKVFLTINKVDNTNRQYESSEFYNLGYKEYFCISSISGSGTGELLDAVVKALPGTKGEEDTGIPKFAIVGRPNVGKSSFINALLGEERNIVTAVAGTTRDTIHTRYNKFNHDFYLIDTAGLRKKGKTMDNIEFYSVMRSVKAIESADVCLLMLDATQGIEAQDMSIFSLIVKNSKAIVILVNKWDLVEKDNKTTKDYEDLIRHKLAPFNDIPIVFISALTKQRIFKVIEEAVKVFENSKKKIPTSKLNEFLQKTVEEHEPPSVKGKYIKIKYATQLPTHSPSFAFFCNHPQYVQEAYKRYLENKLRENFDFTGVPVRIFIRQK